MPDPEIIRRETPLAGLAADPTAVYPQLAASTSQDTAVPLEVRGRSIAVHQRLTSGVLNLKLAGLQRRICVTDHGHFVLINVYVPNAGGGNKTEARLRAKLDFLHLLADKADGLAADGREVPSSSSSRPRRLRTMHACKLGAVHSGETVQS